MTYTGDTLIATKITGECQVPKGEVAFRANLFPIDDEGDDTKRLDPIPLNESAASKWNIKKLDRYTGEGRTSTEKNEESEFVEGQLILFDGYFSFLYLPTKQHIFFSRPSPQLITHLMKEVIDIDDELDNMKDHVQRCFEKDVGEDFIEPRKKTLVKEVHKKPRYTFSDILRRDQSSRTSEETNALNSWVPPSLKSSMKKDTKFSFFGFHKWMGYIDSVIKPDEKNDGFM